MLSYGQYVVAISMQNRKHEKNFSFFFSSILLPNLINERTYLPVVWNLTLLDSSWDSATIALKAQEETEALSVQCFESTLLTCSQAFKLPKFNKLINQSINK